jgi:adenine-specific DNA-methyltransferase
MQPMNQPIKSILSQPYNQKIWGGFLHNELGADISPINIAVDDFNKKIVKSSFVLGSITINHQIIEIYEITIADNIALERNRVGLYQQIWRKRRTASAFLVVFTKKESKKWRVSYVSENVIRNESDEIISYSTSPKRFTFLLGEGEVTRTAEERFSALMANPARNLDSWKECFSVEKISKEFFNQYKSHYQQFCSAIINTPSQRTAIFNNEDKAIRDFCKKLLGRIVFLYFLQKKGWLLESADKQWGEGNPNFMTTLFNNFPNKDSFYSDCLTTLFFDTLNKPRKDDIVALIKGKKYKIPYLNGGLFEEDGKDKDQREKFRNINFPAELFHALFEFLDAYNFTIYEDDPEDQTIAVDPEMLGHIFENLLEDNKDKGAFYTPKEIVQYMARESLIEYLLTCFEKNANINREWIEKLLQNRLELADKEFTRKHANIINDALDDVKICDPAIGSGAFPMGLLHEIYHAKQNIHIIQQGDLADFDSAKVKRNIIQNSIYGVDIEAGAVDIARLRFWLSLVVDEVAPQPLPNLDYKIVVGNSLVSLYDGHIINIDWDIRDEVLTKKRASAVSMFESEADLWAEKKQLLENLVSHQKKYFTADNKNKEILKPTIRDGKINILINQLSLMRKNLLDNIKGLGEGRSVQNKINALKLQDEFYSATISNLKAKLKNAKVTLEFFDWQLNFPEILNPLLIPEPEKRGFDIVIGNPPYVLFNEDETSKHFKSKFTSANNGKINLYKIFIEFGVYLLRNNGTLFYINPNSYLTGSDSYNLRMFLLENTKIINIIEYTEKDKVFENVTQAITILGLNRMKTKNNKLIMRTAKHGELIVEQEKFSFLPGCSFIPINNVISKILMIKESLNTFSDIYQGEINLTAKKDYFSKLKNKKSLPMIRGNNIGKFIKVGDIVDYCDTNADARGHYKNKRIVTQQVSNQSQSFRTKALLLEPNILCGNSTNYIIPKVNSPKLNIEVILGIVNSNTFNYFFNYFSSTNHLTCEELENIPVPVISNIAQNKITIKTNQIIIQKSQNQDTRHLEQEIDNLVYKLYGLTYDEVKIIQPDFPLSPAEYEKIKNI